MDKVELHFSHTVLTFRTKPDQTIICYQPLDHSVYVKRFLAHWQPDTAVFLESDFWPNLIIETARRNIIVQFASAQLSSTAFINWKKRPELATQLFSAAQLICAVDDEQRQRFEQLCQLRDSRRQHQSHSRITPRD